MGVPHVERNISRDLEARKEFLEKGYDLLPVVEIGESVITLYTGEPLLIEVLVAEGYL
ncbi:MAG: hypothetical protein QOH93_2081 [Chloroflexia bacterium]|jgi:hypothetical protein|nr:hypothetical protein [Chloroflexia bacterium]